MRAEQQHTKARKDERGRWTGHFRCVGRGMRLGRAWENRENAKTRKTAEGSVRGQAPNPWWVRSFCFCGFPLALRPPGVRGAHKQFQSSLPDERAPSRARRLRGFAVLSRFRDFAISGRRTDSDTRAASGSPPPHRPLSSFRVFVCAVQVAAARISASMAATRSGAIHPCSAACRAAPSVSSTRSIRLPSSATSVASWRTWAARIGLAVTSRM